MGYYNEVIKDSPVAYWRMSDVSGSTCTDVLSSFNGTYAGSGTTKGIAGAVNGNYCTTFNGSGYVTLPVDSFNYGGATAFSVELWHKGTNTGYQTLIAHNRGASGWSGWEVGVSNGNQWRFTSEVSAGTSSTIDVLTGSTTGNSTDGNWHHVVVVYSGTGVQFYIDGTTANSGSGTVTVSGSGIASWIGSRNGGAGYFGSIDEVAIYTTALSSTRVQVHYRSGVAQRRLNGSMI